MHRNNYNNSANNNYVMPQPQYAKPPLAWHRCVKELARGDGMSLVEHPPNFIVPPAFAAFQNLPPVDLQGGTLLDAHEEEELDDDGCRVQIITYRILSADGTEELTKRIRRKIKIDCTQMMRRLEVSNRNEAKVEEKCERMMGDIKGFRPVHVTSSNKQLVLDPNNVQDVAISNALSQVPDTFMSMLSQEKDNLVKMFPDLFATMRSESKLIPSTQREIVMNPDGSTTTVLKSSKSYSSHFSKSETYVNGVKQMSKSKFRAFVEYKGPDGGFRVKLADSAEDELSEDETEDDDKSSRISEIPDSESEISFNHVPSKPEIKKRLEKAWFAAKELVDSEQRYVEKLKLLDDFRKRITTEGVLDKDKTTKLFANISSLYTFHNMHLLPQLMEARREWQTTKRIANVMRKQAPFLKMYSEYTNNYERAMKLFDEAMRKKKRFNEIVRETEKLPECEGLPLSHHLICPVQRVMRYQLLLQEYKKYLGENDADLEDAKIALELVLQAASHANEMMKKLEGFGKVIEVQEQLGSVSLVSPGRELLRSGPIHKISSTTDKSEERFLFLFNDIILLASERKMIGMAKYKLRAYFHACHTQVCEGDDLEREHSFYLRGSDGSGPQRCIELFTDTQKEKNDWVEAICSVVEDARANSASFGKRGSVAESTASSDARNCGECDVEFSLWSRGVRCGRCKRKLCKKCFGRYRHESKHSKICELCAKNVGIDALRRSASSHSNGRQSVLAVPAYEKDILHSSHVKIKGSMGKSMERFLVVRKDFCLYSYLTPKDTSAVAMLPLPGCEVKMCGEKHTFSVRVGSRRMYVLTVADDQNQARWMAALDLAANANFNAAPS